MRGHAAPAWCEVVVNFGSRCGGLWTCCREQAFFSLVATYQTVLCAADEALTTISGSTIPAEVVGVEEGGAIE